MKFITKNMRLLIVGAGFFLMAAASTGCSSKMGCPGGITQGDTEATVKHG